MALSRPPVTQQIQRDPRPQTGVSPGPPLPAPAQLAQAARCPLLDRAGGRLLFGDLFGEQRALLVFVRHFLCYTTKEYVEDLAKVPKSVLRGFTDVEIAIPADHYIYSMNVVLTRDADIRLVVIGQSSYHHIQPFCSLTGYTHEMYVDPERHIYQKLGMNMGEAFSISAQSPHVKSNMLSGSLKSLWRAVTGPAFDFQGDPAQQGGALILGPGNKAHFMHLDRSRMDHMPINTLLEQAGVQSVDFTHRPRVIDV